MYAIEALVAYFATKSKKTKILGKNVTQPNKPNSTVAIIALFLTIAGGALSISLIFERNVMWGATLLLGFTFMIIEIMRRSRMEVQ